MDIRCRKTQCKFNDRYTCRAKNIEISEKDLCNMYEKDVNKEIKDVSKGMFMKTPNYAAQRDTKNMKIECKNNCVLNKDGRCIANGITINDLSGKPCCMTVVLK